MAEEDEVDVNFKVIESKIDAVGGIARIHEEILEHLEIEEGKEVQVFSNESEKAVIVELTADKLIGKDAISLRRKDLERLGVKEGDMVHIRAHKTVADALGDLKEAIASRFRSGDESDEEGDKEDK